MNIYQILIGEIPSELNDCINSVKEFALNNGYNYYEINSLTDTSYGTTNIRNLSDFEKIRILTTIPNSLVIDWDVEIDSTTQINFGSKLLINPQADFFLYNGNDLGTFQIINENMINNFVSEEEVGQLNKAFIRCIKNKSITIDESNFINSGLKHLRFHTII